MDIPDFITMEEEPLIDWKEKIEGIDEEKKKILAKKWIIDECSTFIRLFQGISISRKRIKNKLMRKLMNYKEQCKDSSLSTSQLRSREGNIHRVAWKFISHVLKSNPHVKYVGRRWNRYANFMKTMETRAFTPFDAILNDLYFELQKRIRVVFARMGLGYFFNPRGIIHEKELLIYDLMDLFRPYILLSLVEWTFTHDPEDYVNVMKNEYGKKIYHINRDDVGKLENLYLLFNEIVEKEFVLDDAIMPSHEIINRKITAVQDFFV